jgi:hypothetical protein
MAHGANAAEALHEDRHFPEGTAFDEALEAAELHHVEAGPLDPVVGVEQEGDLAVTFDSRHGLDDHAFQLMR